MAFRISDLENQGKIDWIGEWPFPARAQFIRSNAYDTFLRELERYVRGEVAGRSFLIAGHRGAGKTSLVRRAVEELNYSIIDSTFGAASMQAPDAERMLDQRRPLLVRLHGPSLIAPEKPADAAGKKRPDGPLVQITIALYRALAAEYGRAFANHARDKIYQAQIWGRAPDRATDYLELAGQFTLELDNFPKPSTLRDFYRRLDRIGAGVLWPFGIGEALQKAHLNDRGIREIVALATAAQAFAVCTAEIKTTETGNDTRKREDSVETKGEATLKDVANKLIGIAAGVGVGVLTNAPLGTTAAAALGLAAGALSVLTFSWASKRSVTSERKRDYTFIIEPDKQSLERDLPLVIERVRDAGLAPVFVLDELDKVDTAVAIASLVDRLKHLTTDYGCFCFLTDRKYYVDLMRKVEKEAFPVEHTYFSHLLFILPHPDGFLDFLRDITQWDPPTSLLAPADAAARSIFGLFVLHRSKLNMVEVLREIAGLCHPNGELKLSTPDLQRGEYLLAASIQLAIGLILKSDAMRQRVVADPSFMQWALDALYILSRAWESKAAKVTLDRHSIVCCLLERSGKQVADADAARAEEMLQESGVGSIDLGIIDREVGRLADLLCNSAMLKQGLVEAGQSELAELVPATHLIKSNGQAREFEFLYDMYGQEVAVSEALKAAAAKLPPDVVDRIGRARDFLDAFKMALASLDIGLTDLIALPVLPSTMNANEFDNARSRLADAVAQGQLYARLPDDLTLVQSLMAFVEQTATRFEALFRLSLQIAADTRISKEEPLPKLLPAIDAVARYVDLRAFFQQASSSALDRIADRPADPAGAPPSGNAEDVAAWRDGLETLRKQLTDRVPGDKGQLSEAAWSAWRGRLRQYLTSDVSIVEPADYADLVCTAANLAPGNLFRRDLSQMSLADWSVLCLSGFPAQDSAKAPAWTFVVGLAILGFDARLVSEAAQLLPQSTPTFDEALTRVAPRSEMAGHLLIMRSDARSLASDPPKKQPERALLALPPDKLQEYDAALAWLRKHDGLLGVIDEEV